MPRRLIKQICPSLEVVKICFGIIFFVITILGCVLIYFDLNGNNAYDLVAKTSDFSLSVASLESAYQRADLLAREMVVSGKKDNHLLENSRLDVWIKLGEVTKSVYEERQNELLISLREGLISKFENQDKLILSGPIISDQDLRTKSVDESRNVAELFITLKLDQARGITARADDAEKLRRKFRVSVLVIFVVIYSVWLLSYMLTTQAITARIMAAEILRRKYELAKAENENFVGEELYSEVLEFLEQKHAA